LLGLDASREKAEALLSDARTALAGFGDRAALLEEIAAYIVDRQH
jgi:farnesyl diphosphate synthase